MQTIDTCLVQEMVMIGFFAKNSASLLTVVQGLKKTKKHQSILNIEPFLEL